MDEVTIKKDDILKLFNEFDEKLRKRTFRTALRKSASILRNQAIKNLKAKVSNIDRRDRWGNTLRRGIVIKIFKNLMGATVHILGNFKLKFFELGTKERFAKKLGRKRLKKPRYTGRIDATHFFENAKDQTQIQVFGSLDDVISQSVKKINDKYKSKK